MLFALMPLMTVAPAKSVSAFGFESAESASVSVADAAAEAERFLLLNDNISDAAVLVIGDNCVAGVRVTGIVSKKTCVELLNEVHKRLKESLPNVSAVYVTTAPGEIIFLKDAKRRLTEGGEPLKIYGEVLDRADGYRKFSV